MPKTFHKHPRLKGHDYTQGAYFVTLGTKPRRALFGQITGTAKDAIMDLNEFGRIVDECIHLWCQSSMLHNLIAF
jgi:hypothetical protein